MRSFRQLAVFLLLLSMACLGDNGQQAFEKLCRGIAKYQKSEYWVAGDLREEEPALLKLIDDTIESGDILEDSSPHNEELPGIYQLLAPSINGKNNPMFRYVLFKFLEGKRFASCNEEIRKAVCLKLYRMLENSEYSKMRRDDIIEGITEYLTEVSGQSAEVVSILERLCISEFSAENNDIMIVPLKMLGHCDKDIFSNAFYQAMAHHAVSGIQVWNKDKKPFLSCLILVSAGIDEERNVSRLRFAFMLDTVQGETSFTRYHRKLKVFMDAMSLVRKRPITELLREMLENDLYQDNGNDVFPRFTGVAYFAAKALHAQLEGFPDVSFKTREVYLQGGREKCMEWFALNPQWKYRNDTMMSDGGSSLQRNLKPDTAGHSSTQQNSAIQRLMENFDKDGAEQQRKTVARLLEMLDDESFASSHSAICYQLTVKCGCHTLFSAEAKKTLNSILLRILSKGKHSMTDIQCLQLMFFIDGDDLEQDVYERLRKDAAKCSRRFSAEIRHTAPFLALVFLAQNGTQDELRQFLSLMHNNGKILELKQARYIIPYVSLLRKRKAVLMLCEYLRQRGGCHKICGK